MYRPSWQPRKPHSVTCRCNKIWLFLQLIACIAYMLTCYFFAFCITISHCFIVCIGEKNWIISRDCQVGTGCKYRRHGTGMFEYDLFRTSIMIFLCFFFIFNLLMQFSGTCCSHPIFPWWTGEISKWKVQAVWITCKAHNTSGATLW